VIIDLYSRRVIALSWFARKPLSGDRWAVSNRIKRDLAIKALDMAIGLRNPPKGCIHHSDRGSQYCSGDYHKPLKQHGFLVSPLTDVNICCRATDNSLSADLRRKSPVGQGMVDTLFKSLKAELI